MARKAHLNLFRHGDAEQVYAALQSDLDRDTWFQVCCYGGYIVCVLGAIFVADAPAWVAWLCFGIAWLERALAVFVDNSNRNWAMHVIDWIEAKPEQDRLRRLEAEESGGD